VIPSPKPQHEQKGKKRRAAQLPTKRPSKLRRIDEDNSDDDGDDGDENDETVFVVSNEIQLLKQENLQLVGKVSLLETQLGKKECDYWECHRSLLVSQNELKACRNELETQKTSPPTQPQHSFITYMAQTPEEQEKLEQENFQLRSDLLEKEREISQLKAVLRKNMKLAETVSMADAQIREFMTLWEETSAKFDKIAKSFSQKGN